MNKKEKLESKKKDLKLAIEELDKQIRHEDIPEHMRKEWELMFGWPKISTELGLRDKLDKDTYNKLYDQVLEKIQKIANMVPDYKNVKDKECWRCIKVQEVYKK